MEPQTRLSPLQGTENWQRYHNQSHGYSISYPQDFKVIEESDGRQVIFARPPGVTTNPKYGGPGGQGMAIYTRSYDPEHAESQTRPTENTIVANYQALRWTDNPSYIEDIWVSDPDTNKSLRITISTFAEEVPYNKINFDLFLHMLDTLIFDS
jgi:hypothetical protein